MDTQGFKTYIVPTSVESKIKINKAKQTVNMKLAKSREIIYEIQTFTGNYNTFQLIKKIIFCRFILQIVVLSSLKRPTR